MGDPLDHAKHLRAVHFSLIVVSLIIAIASSFASDSLYARAHDEALAIEKLQEIIGWIPHRLESAVANSVESNKEQNAIASFHGQWSSSVVYTSPDGQFGRANFTDQTGELPLDRFNWNTAIGVFPDVSFVPHDDHPAAGLDFDVAYSLGQFIVAWDSLNYLNRFHAITGFDSGLAAYRGYFPTGSSALSKRDCDEEENDTKPIEFRVRNKQMSGFFLGSTKTKIVESQRPPCGDRSNTDTTAYGPPYAIKLLENRLGERGTNTLPYIYEIEVPAKIVQLDLDMQSDLIDLFDGKMPLTTGAFENVFVSINELRRDLNELGIENLEISAEDPGTSGLANFVSKLRALNEKQVELFGIAAPVQVVRTWGSLILSGIMLYLAIHIRAFTVPVEKPPALPGDPNCST